MTDDVGQSATTHQEDVERIIAYRDRGAAEGWTLATLRNARHLTQTSVAEQMHISQARVSAIEHAATGVELGTLAAYVAATGGRLELVARYDDADIIFIPLPDEQTNRKARLKRSIDRVKTRDAEILDRLAE